MSFDHLKAIETLNTTNVEYLQYKRVRRQLDLFLATTKASKKGALFQIQGNPGVGKSNAVLQLVYDHNSRAAPHTVPAAFVEAPSTATPKNLYERFFAAVGDPLRRRRTLPQMMSDLPDICDQRGVEFLVVDECHNLMGGESRRAIERTAATFTSIVNMLSRPVIIVGNLKLKKIDLNGSAARRVKRICEIQPFDLKKQADQDELWRVIDKLMSDAPRLPQWFFTAEGSEFLRENTGGYLGFIVPILEQSIENALDDESAFIKKAHLLAAAKNLNYRSQSCVYNAFHGFGAEVA